MTDLNKIADKIQHLLDKTVANGATEAEAETALLLAQKLMAKYNIEANELNQGEKVEYSFEPCKCKVNPRSKWICMIIASSFAVRAIISGNRICYFGHKTNVMAAKSALEFANRVMERGLTKACRDQGLEPSQSGASLVYNAYAQGFITALKEALDAQTVALAVVVPEDVNKAFAEKFPDARKGRSTTMKMGHNQQEAYKAGRKDGSQVMDKRSLEA